MKTCEPNVTDINSMCFMWVCVEELHYFRYLSVGAKSDMFDQDVQYLTTNINQNVPSACSVN